jgi:Tfp pilus assembly pilus retraction ATPase PilT
LNTHSIKTNIKKKDVDQIDSIIETSNMIWMITLKQYAENLISKWIIDSEEVDWLLNKNPQNKN